MATQRILIVDDHPMSREGLASAVEDCLPDYAVLCAGSIAEALALLRQHGGWRLILLGDRLPDAEGLAGLFQLHHAQGQVPVALLAAKARPALAEVARAAGAIGCLRKQEPLDRLITAIGRLLAGESLFPAGAEPSAGMKGLQARLEALSPAQARVLAALARGHLNKQIAHELGLTERTVKAHMTAIFRKLGVANRVQALLAVRLLLDPEGLATGRQG